MTTLPQPRNNQEIATEKRIAELARDGYVEQVHGRWLLTDKGWRTLSGAAKTKHAPHRQSKAQIEYELHDWARNIMRIGGWWQVK